MVWAPPIKNPGYAYVLCPQLSLRHVLSNTLAAVLAIAICIVAECLAGAAANKIQESSKLID